MQSHYPTATFAIEQSADDPTAVHLVATVDVDDPDEVVDVTIERELALQQDEGIPVHVIPVRTPERLAALQRRERATRPLKPVAPSRTPMGKAASLVAVSPPPVYQCTMHSVA